MWCRTHLLAGVGPGKSVSLTEGSIHVGRCLPYYVLWSLYWNNIWCQSLELNLAVFTVRCTIVSMLYLWSIYGAFGCLFFVWTCQKSASNTCLSPRQIFLLERNSFRPQIALKFTQNWLFVLLQRTGKCFLAEKGWEKCLISRCHKLLNTAIFGEFPDAGDANYWTRSPKIRCRRLNCS